MKKKKQHEPLPPGTPCKFCGLSQLRLRWGRNDLIDHWKCGTWIEHLMAEKGGPSPAPILRRSLACKALERVAELERKLAEAEEAIREYGQHKDFVAPILNGVV